MNSLVILLFVPVLILTAVPVSAELVSVPTVSSLPSSPLVITAYQASPDGLDFVQIFNSSDELVSLDTMHLRYVKKADQTVTVSIPLSGWMKPNSHVLIAATDVLATSDHVSFRFVPSIWEPKLVSIESPMFAPVSIPTDLKTDGIVYKRTRTATGYSTAVSSLNSPLVGGAIEADLLYTVPDVPALEFVEISARAKACSPFDMDATCSDFIKLRMLPGFNVGKVSEYRVRTGGGESISNAFSLANSSVQGDYLLLRLRDDGENISLTNSGGYIWLEDAYGLMKYEATLVEYADAGSESYIDQSWARNDATGLWQWAMPNPIGHNVFPEVVVMPVETISTCPTGKYRNPETNRCRSIEEAVSELATCEEGKERNPVTNRCRSIIVTASTLLTPCGTGEERNPLTNRCRQVITTSQALAPCEEGQERNPETNRCRKVTSATASTLAAVTDVPSTAKSSNQKWWIAGVMLLAVIGYAVYEWRQEIVLFGKSAATRLRLKK